MRIKAQHRDGFTEHLLKWTLETDVDSEVAHVSSRWFAPNGNGTAEFNIPFDGSILRTNIAAMDALQESYSLPMTDCGMLILEIERDGKVRTWDLYGCEGLLEDHPELEPFFEFWRPLSNAIESKLALR